MQEFTSPVEADGGKYLVKPKMTVCDKLFDDSQDTRLKTSYKRVNRQEVIWKYIGLDEEGKAMREPYKSIANWYALKHADAYLIKGIAIAATEYVANDGLDGHSERRGSWS